jgi:integrase
MTVGPCFSAGHGRGEKIASRSDAMRLPWNARLSRRTTPENNRTNNRAADVHWNARFTRFCLMKLKQTPQDAGAPAITAYLNYLALERQVSASTQKQALNAMVFLTRKVFGIGDFTIEKPASATGGHRRPPVVLTRDEVRAIVAHLEGAWKIAALLMYGSGLRIMECLRLRVKDLDFGQGAIIIHDGKGGRHRVVPLPQALEERLKEHLAKARDKHLQDLAVGAGDVHMPESLTRKYPNTPREWPWQKGRRLVGLLDAAQRSPQGEVPRGGTESICLSCRDPLRPSPHPPRGPPPSP